MRTLGRANSPRAGFTLAEVMVTLVIVGIGLTLVLQGLNTAKLTAAQTRNLKLARDLAVLTLGQVEAGLFQEEEGERMFGSYAEEGYEDFSFEVVFGDDTLTDVEQALDEGAFDTWDHRRSLEEEEETEEDEEAVEPYETVRIRVTFPAIRDYKNDLVLERWMDWERVYGVDEEEMDAQLGGSGGKDAGSSTGGGK